MRNTRAYLRLQNQGVDLRQRQSPAGVPPRARPERASHDLPWGIITLF
jgi:hypothetical protein